MEDSMEWSGDLAAGAAGGKILSPAPSYDGVNNVSSTRLAHPSEGGGGSVSAALDPHRSSAEGMLGEGSSSSTASSGSGGGSGDPSTSGIADGSGGAFSAGSGGRATTAAADTAEVSGGPTAGGGHAAAGGGEFLCYECGLDFRSVKELQLHMVRKTAWSNQGLIGCRVSCLVDNREWHEGLVTQVSERETKKRIGCAD